MGKSGILLVLLATTACARRGVPAPPTGVAAPTRSEIWAAIQEPASRYVMDGSFIYALVAAESDFNPRARRGSACGLLQLTPEAWRSVSGEPYEPAVWQWRANLETGIEYLAYLRSFLHRKGVFSYPLLLASFHYGLQYVEGRHFDLGRIPVPDSPIYRQLWQGNLKPVAPPPGRLPAG